MRLRLIATATLVASCVLIAWDMQRPTVSRQPFDRVAWAQAVTPDMTNDPGCFRGGMALDLIEGKTLVGKPRAEVVALLGIPFTAVSHQVSYEVGQCGMLWGHDEIELTFGADGKATKAIWK